MTQLGHAAGTDFTSPPVFSGARSGTGMLVLVAGLAGMLAAYELRRAGCSVRMLEFQYRSGGRNLILRGDDTLTELGGETCITITHCCTTAARSEWRSEPFIEVNHNGYLHSSTTYGGVPQRRRDVMSDFTGHTAELLAKAVQRNKLDQPVTAEEKHDLLVGHARCRLRLQARPGRRAEFPTVIPARRGDAFWPVALAVVQHDLRHADDHVPAGRRHGHDRARVRQAGQRPRHPQRQAQPHPAGPVRGDRHLHRCKPRRGWGELCGAGGGAIMQAKAGRCVCTIPLSVLSQLDVQVSAPMQQAIAAVPYASSIKVGLGFKRRFREEDEAIYSGISFTDQQIGQVSYSSHGYFSNGPVVLLDRRAIGAA